LQQSLAGYKGELLEDANAAYKTGKALTAFGIDREVELVPVR
jgi:hypothetical protein